jgi:hypothetical protein
MAIQGRVALTRWSCSQCGVSCLKESRFRLCSTCRSAAKRSGLLDELTKNREAKIKSLNERYKEVGAKRLADEIIAAVESAGTRHRAAQYKLVGE